MIEVTDTNNVSIIGVGASAGGLEAVSQLLSSLSPELPHAVVILQHLSPNYKSMMTELLTRETRLTVCALENNVTPKAGVVYVVPPNKNASYKNGKLRLLDAAPEISPKPSVNEFFVSLASELAERSVGVILSGTGTDGTVGLRAIQHAGGITITQCPKTAKYSGMPLSAIDAEVADFILSPKEIAEKLMEIPSNMEKDALVPPSILEQILQTLKEESKVDFSGYKAGTLSRRIRRRMVTTGHQEMEGYADWVKGNPSELELLSKDILISVTSFFRDNESFAALEKYVLELFDSLSPDEEIRVWVAGCATGEEAYTLAILLLELIRERELNNPVLVFATDIDEEALNIARQGIYPAAGLTAVPEGLVNRYFSERKDERYEVHKSLRDVIVFARHNVIDDPPFLRLNLVTCRNVLIYFDNPLQAKVLQRFHFALKESGVLFLGRSESIAQAEQLFSPVNRRERLFKKIGESKAVLQSQSAGKLTTFQGARPQSPKQLLDALTEHLDATAALCTVSGKVIQSSGLVEKFFRFPTGSGDLILGDIIHEDFKSELLALFHRLKKTQTTQQGRSKSLYDRQWQLTLSFVNTGSDSKILLLILPVKEDIKELVPAELNDIYSDELQVTREQLQSLIEELATANEEMQSLNEEAQASNEELQATNEEMEAANEELQATNEELVSLNEELSVKTTELTLLNEEYSHLYDSFDFPVLVFDESLNLIRFNSPANAFLNLRINALNSHVEQLRLPDYLEGLRSLLEKARAHGDKQERLLEHYDASYQLIISPGLDNQGMVQFLVVNLVNVTEIQHTRHQLTESENRLQTLMENTTVMIAMKDLSGKYLYANDAFRGALGLDDVELEGRTDFEIFPDFFAGEVWSQDLEAIRKLELVESECHLIVDGVEKVINTRHQVLRDYSGKPNLIITEAEDITLRKRAEDKLKIAAKVYQQAGEAIVVTDDQGIIMSINEAFSEITGYIEKDALGQSIGHLLNSGRHSKDFYNQMWGALEDKGYWQGEIWNKRKDGDVYPEWLTINRIDNDKSETEYFIAVFSDITNLKESQRKVEFLATHDALTGLPNRNLFMDRLDNSVARAKRNNGSVAVMFIDLDDFKSINDTLGHDVGDQLLIEVSKTLQLVIRDLDTVSRLGGDEFTIILGECDPEEIHQIATRVLDELSEPLEIGSKKLFASASIGIAVYPDDGQDSHGLLKSADTAMYKAKELGRNRYQYFHSEMRDRLLKQSAMETALKNAIRKRQFRLAYQPKFTVCDSRKLIGAEALLRWLDPQIGNIPPSEFIPVAEKNGSIVDLGKLVIEMLVEQIARWINHGVAVPQIALNLSAKNLQQDDFVQFFCSVIDEYMVDKKYFKVEITEAILMETASVEVANLYRLKDEGFQISIDDFGTGYSSLSYLKELPLSELKIDKSFVDGLGVDGNDEAICKAILSLAKAMELEVVAEGVETESQLKWLVEHDCDFLQGFLLSRPLEADDFEKLLIQQ